MYFTELFHFILTVLFSGTIDKSSGKGHEGLPWFVGCLDSSAPGPAVLSEVPGVNDLDPATCSQICQDEGYQIAALTRERCYCTHVIHGSMIRKCLNTSSHGGSKNITGHGTTERRCCGRVLCLPCGDGPGSSAVYRTRGPFLRNISLASLTDRVHAGIPFSVVVSGHLSGPPGQPTGFPSLRGQQLSNVMVEFSGRSPKGQSSQRVTVLDDGFFAVTTDWVVETSGKYQINVTVSNPLSQLSSILHLSVLQPSPDGLEITVLHGPLGAPSCLPYPANDTPTGAVETAYLGDHLTIQAHVAEGLRPEFSWHFSHEEEEEKEEEKEVKEVEDELKSLKTDCRPVSDGLSSTVNWTFEKEGVHSVSVNASNAYGWTQETVHIVVVRGAVSTLSVVSVSGYQLAAGQSITLDLELFTSIAQLLLLNLTLMSGDNHNVGHSSDNTNEDNRINNSNSISNTIISTANANRNADRNDGNSSADSNASNRNSMNDNSNDSDSSHDNSNDSNSDDNSKGDINNRHDKDNSNDNSDVDSNVNDTSNDCSQYNSYDNSNGSSNEHHIDNSDDHRDSLHLASHDRTLNRRFDYQFGHSPTHMADVTHNQSHGRDSLDRSAHSLPHTYTIPASLPHTQTLSLAADPHHPSPLHLHTYGKSNCHRHLRLHYHLPTTVGQYRLSASVFSTTDPLSVLLSATLPHPLVVYERIHALWPSGSWSPVVPTLKALKLAVTSQANRMGSRVIWTIGLDGTIVVNKTTEEWTMAVSPPMAGRYQVTVKAFNPVSWASFHTQFLVQDPVGELVLNVPSLVTVEQLALMSFIIPAGSNMTVAVLVNATLLYHNTSYTTGEEVTVALFFDHGGMVEVELRAENHISSGKKSVSVCVQMERVQSHEVNIDAIQPTVTSRRPVHSPAISAVTIHTENQASPTDTDITFLLQTDEPEPLEFLWHFGDSRPVRTTSRTVTKRFRSPGRYSVLVVAFNGLSSFTSEVLPLVVQRAVRPNRLVHRASALLDQTVGFSCRVNAGTDLIYLWAFGDGTSRLGRNAEQHVFHRTGEFTVEVKVFNLVSSTSMSSQIFVVKRPCQPPPVKNMGPLKIQVRRYEAVCLGVTYEAEIDCDITEGLQYTWTLHDSTGHSVALPATDTHRQSITLPSHLLQYDTYTARAKVQIVGNVVYSNYSVRVEVVPSPPVAFIRGGTNVFISNRNITMVTLDGQHSYDPDFPANPLSYSWSCKPVSSIVTSCFDRYVPATFSVIMFPSGVLKRNFDQFQFTLTVRSRERSASADTFITVTPNLIRKVSVYCLQCQGDSVNWDQAFSVSAVCEDCDVPPVDIHYSWRLYLVNAPSKPIMEMPFCRSVDLSSPSNIIEGPAINLLPATTSTTTLHPSTTHTPITPTTGRPTPKQGSQYPHTSSTPPSGQMENHSASSTAAAFEQPEPSPSYIPSSVNTTQQTPGSEGELYPPFPVGEIEPPEPPYPFSELSLDEGSVPDSAPFSRQSDVIAEFPTDYDFPDESDFPFPVLESGDMGGRPVPLPTEAVLEPDETSAGPSVNHTDPDYDVSFLGLEEGDPGISEGRPTGVGAESSSSGGDSGPASPESGGDEGSNLVDSSPSLVVREPTLLDLPRELVETGLFESHTYTGISSSLLSLQPFSLRPDSRYMLEVTAKSHDAVLGRTQLFLATNPTPRGMTCQVQPGSGVEIHTHFSIFCTSGKEDLLYEYRFRVGDSPSRLLYQGPDFQHYFNLPSGDPEDDYKVTVSIEIRNSRFGSTTKPCPVTVRVQPSFLRNTSSSYDPDLELSESGLRNLSALVLLGNSLEIHNYILLLSSILNRLSLAPAANARMQTHARRTLISAVCELQISDQESMMDNMCILKDLLRVTQQVTLVSASQVTAHIRSISGHFRESSVPVPYPLDQRTVNMLVTLLSYSLQAAFETDVLTPDTLSDDDITQAAAVADNNTPGVSSGDDIMQTAAAADDHTLGASTGDDITQAAPSNGDSVPQAVATTHDFTADLANDDGITQAAATTDDLTSALFNSDDITQAKAFSREQVGQLVSDSLQTATDLLLKYILFNKAHRQHSVSTSVMALQTMQHDGGLSALAIGDGSTTFHLPDSLVRLLFGPDGGETGSGADRPCLLSQLIVFPQNPYFWASAPAQLSGPVVDLSLYNCSTRSKIPVRSLPQPINIQFQQTPRNWSSENAYILRRSQINYHSFNITQQHLQQAIQFTAVFSRPPNKTFPIMLLFRMFERPNPSLYHLHRIHQWEGNTARITLPPSYLNAAGVGHLALLNADYRKPHRYRYLSEQVSYSLTLETSLCLSWDSHQGAWTHHGCTPQQGGTTAAVICSCNQLRTLTVVQQTIPSNQDAADLDHFLSLNRDLTVVGVLAVCVSLYALGLAVCRRADVVSERNDKVHYLSDNSPSDPHLYAVTIHTGLRSAANMTAKAYIVLYGENGASQTRELHIPGCSLFRRNSSDTFILSTTDGLGPLWGIHLWHDNFGASPTWYLKRVEVSEVVGGHVKGRSWLFLGQCWLAVNESDGQVERRLRVCTQGLGFTKLLHLKICDHLPDLHHWLSVNSHPSPSRFTHTQRLSICLLLLLGYTCANAILISQMDDIYTLELGLIDVSAVSLTTGVFSVLAVLPAVTVISLLFRLREVKMRRPRVKEDRSREPDVCSVKAEARLTNDSVLESRLPWNGLQLWALEAWKKKYECPDLVSVSIGDMVTKDKVIPKDLVAPERKGSLEIQGGRDSVTQGNVGDPVIQEKEGDLVSQWDKDLMDPKDLLTGNKALDPVPQGNHRNLACTGSRDLVTQKYQITQLEQVTNERDGDRVIHCNKDLVTDVVIQLNGDQVTQKEKDLITHVKDGSVSSSSGFEDAVSNDNSLPGRSHGNSVSDDTDSRQEECSNRSGGYQVNSHLSRTSGSRVRRLPCWCLHLAWALCLLLSLACLVLSASLGIRFSRSKVLLWAHSLFFSLLSCIFLIQPAIISIVAVAVSFWYRKTSDFCSVSGITEVEALKLWRQDGTDLPEKLQFKPLHCPQERPSYFEKVLAARQRARYLRLVRPPSPGELRRTVGRKRKETVIHKTLWELSLCGSMLVLLLCVTYGGTFNDHCHLNKAVRKHFTRGPDNPFLSIQSHDDWWSWSQTSLLDLLYKNTTAKTKAAVVQGTHILIGEPILWKTEESNSPLCQVPSVMAGLVPECPPVHSFGTRGSSGSHSAVKLPTVTAQRVCGQLGCYSGPGAQVGLGLTRSEAVSRLQSLQSGGWVGRLTVALKVQITLYSPSSNLFTSVTLLMERSPGGVLLPSASVQSARVYRSTTVRDYVVMICQLLFLLLSLLQFCLHVYSAGQQGLMGYWRTPWNWLEVGVLLVTLVYYIYYICQSVVTLEVVELLQGRDHRKHVDLSLLASWEQRIHTLRGAMLFLLSMKCLRVLRVHRTMATSVTILTSSLSSLLWPMVSGVPLLVALSCLGNLLFVQESWAFSSLPRSLRTLLSHYRGLRGHFSSGVYSVHSPAGLSETLYHGALCLTATVVWTALVIGVVSSLVRAAKRANRKGNVVSLSEIAIYIRRKVTWRLIGQHRPRLTDSYTPRRNYYLEEFESLVDELLFKLNALSNSLHHTLPPKAHRYREGSPSVSPTQSPSSLESQCSAMSERTHMTEETTLNDHANISHLNLLHREEHPRRSHPLRSQLETETLQFLQLKGLRNMSPTLDTVSASSSPLQAESGSEGDPAKSTIPPKHRILQTSLGGQSHLSLPESEHLAGAWTEDHLPSRRSVDWLVQSVVLDDQTGHWTKTTASGWSCKKAHRKPRKSHLGGMVVPSDVQDPRRSHATVVVEVVVHDRPRSRALENQGDVAGDPPSPQPSAVRQCWD